MPTLSKYKIDKNYSNANKAALKQRFDNHWIARLFGIAAMHGVLQHREGEQLGVTEMVEI